MFFRAQDELTNDLQKKLILRLGELTGRPKTSTLHIHPLLNNARDLGGDDPEISTISSVQFKTLGVSKTQNDDGISIKKQNNAQWHSDISFEPVPADYTSLRLVELPKTGGGTCFPCLNNINITCPGWRLTLHNLQTLCGPPAMSYTTASRSPTKSSSRPCRLPSMGRISGKPPRGSTSSSTRQLAVRQRTSAPT